MAKKDYSPAKARAAYMKKAHPQHMKKCSRCGHMKYWSKYHQEYRCGCT